MEPRTGMSEGEAAGAERSFGIDELFFSTTDPGGRILTGNPVFARVSAYTAQELRGRAHNVVRHPDMPRLVFRILWRHLRDAAPVAAYVKNRAKDGLPYWVVATVVPLEDGFLSVRFKPSSPTFDLIRGLYDDLREVEDRIEAGGGTRDAAIDASEGHLTEVLAGLGLRDYDDLMHRLLVEEMRSREDLLTGSPAWAALWARTPGERHGDSSHAALVRTLEGFRDAHGRMDERFSDVQEYARLNDALGNRSRDLVGEMHLQSLNMVLAAAHLGDSAAGIGVVARLMGAEADAGTALTARLNERGDALGTQLRELGFRIGIARLLAEMAVFFSYEMLHRPPNASAADDGDLAGNVALLAVALSDSLAHIGRAAGDLERALRRTIADIADLSRLLGVLAALQLNGTIEAARIDGAVGVGQMLSEMADQVTAAQAEVRELASAAAAARARARSGAADDGLEHDLQEIVREAALLKV